MVDVKNPDEFYAQVRKDCEKWEQTEQGQAFLKDQLETEIRKVQDNNKEYEEDTPLPTIPKTIRQRAFGDFYENILEIDIDLLEDYYLLFSTPKEYSDKIIQTFKRDDLFFLNKLDKDEMIFVLFFDTIVDRNDKLRILNLLSKEVKIYLELLDENIISSDFDRDLIACETNDSYWYNKWENFFFFVEYFNSDEYKQSDKYNYSSLPTNHIEITEKPNKLNKYKITKSKKRIQVTWN